MLYSCYFGSVWTPMLSAHRPLLSLSLYSVSACSSLWGRRIVSACVSTTWRNVANSSEYLNKGGAVGNQINLSDMSELYTEIRVQKDREIPNWRNWPPARPSGFTDWRRLSAHVTLLCFRLSKAFTRRFLPCLQSVQVQTTENQGAGIV